METTPRIYVILVWFLEVWGIINYCAEFAICASICGKIAAENLEKEKEEI